MSRAKDITNGIINHAKDKMGTLNVSDKERNDKRMSICQSCEHKTKTGRCGRCGCVLILKTKCSNCTCPVDKW